MRYNPHRVGETKKFKEGRLYSTTNRFCFQSQKDGRGLTLFAEFFKAMSFEEVVESYMCKP